MIDYKKFVENSRKWLSNYIKDNHLQSLVIGISGGIDSTVSCAIAYPVCYDLGIPLIGRSLPTISNHDIEIDVSDLVGNAFCDNYAKKSIEADYIKLLGSLEREGEVSKLQRGNIKARLRMIYLRHLASVHKGVVIDNDNFTEWNLGFWTVGGDSPMDINLGLHYLWKTEIYELAKFLKENLNNERHSEKYVNNEIAREYFLKCQALEVSINLTPTDGNGVSNSDCEQFGLDNYEQVDDVLKTMYYSTYTKEDYIRLIDSYNEQGVDKVMILHQNTEYKRKELPIKPTKEELFKND
jgi:NAD+ synthetase